MGITGTDDCDDGFDYNECQIKKIEEKLKNYKCLGPIEAISMSTLESAKSEYEDLIVKGNFLYGKPKNKLEEIIDKK